MTALTLLGHFTDSLPSPLAIWHSQIEGDKPRELGAPSVARAWNSHQEEATFYNMSFLFTLHLSLFYRNRLSYHHITYTHLVSTQHLSGNEIMLRDDWIAFRAYL